MRAERTSEKENVEDKKKKEVRGERTSARSDRKEGRSRDSSSKRRRVDERVFVRRY